MSFTITIGRDDATRDLGNRHAQLAEPAQRKALMSVIGVRAEQELRSWWTKRDADSPNKMGWPRQHFWAGLARVTAFDPAKSTENTATVVVAHPAIAAKINGATIKPTGAISPITGKPTTRLAIPVHADAYGHWPRSGRIPGLFVWTGGKDNDAAAYLAAKVNGVLVLFYKLVRSVTVPKDPRALPPADEMGRALAETAGDWFARNTGGAST